MAVSRQPTCPTPRPDEDANRLEMHHHHVSFGEIDLAPVGKELLQAFLLSLVLLLFVGLLLDLVRLVREIANSPPLFPRLRTELGKVLLKDDYSVKQELCVFIDLLG